jgi:hypothetical protein
MPEKERRQLVSDLAESRELIGHLDALGGAYWALNMDEILEHLEDEGWKFTPPLGEEIGDS